MVESGLDARKSGSKVQVLGHYAAVLEKQEGADVEREGGGSGYILGGRPW